MRITRRILASVGGVAAGILAVGSLAGCSQQSSAEPDSIDLRVSVWTANEGHLELLNKLGDEFAEQSEEVGSVEFEPSPQGRDYLTVLTTQLAGGNPPDVGWLTEASSLQFINQGALVDLTDTLNETEGYEFDELTPSAMTTWVDEDRVYGVPFSTSPVVMFYNADLFTAAGIPNPDEMLASGDWTWDNLAAAAQTINETTGKEGYFIGPYKFDDQWQSLAHVFYGYGAEPWSEDGTKCTFNSDEMADALGLLSGMIASGAYPEPGSAVDFPSGGAAMTSTFISTANALADAPFQWGMVPLPAGPAGDTGVIGQSAFVAFSNGAHPEQSAELVAYLTKPESQKQLAAFFPSIRESLLNAETLSAANPVLTPEQIEDVVVPSLQNGKISPIHANGVELAPEIRAGLEPIWTGADVPATLDALCSQIEPLLASQD